MDLKAGWFIFIICMLVAIILILVLVLSDNENKWHVFFLTLVIPAAYAFTKTKQFKHYFPPEPIYKPEVIEYVTPYDTIPSKYGIVPKNANRNDIKDTIVYTGELNQIELEI